MTLKQLALIAATGLAACNPTPPAEESPDPPVPPPPAQPAVAAEPTGPVMVIGCVDPESEGAMRVLRSPGGFVMQEGKHEALPVASCERSPIDTGSAYEANEQYRFQAATGEKLELTVAASRGAPPRVTGGIWYGATGVADLGTCEESEPQDALVRQLGCTTGATIERAGPADHPRVTTTLQLRSVSLVDGQVAFDFVDRNDQPVSFPDWQVDGHGINLDENPYFIAERTEDSIFPQFRIRPEYVDRWLRVTHEERFGDRFATGEKVEYGVVVAVEPARE